MASTRWLRIGTILLAATAVLFITLILAGVFDPQPVGELQWEQPLSAQTIAAQTRRVIWLERSTPAGPYSLRLTAVHRAGEMDVGYGLVVGDEEQFLAAAVSPLGYAAVWQQPDASFLFPWQAWPHVRADANEIWLDRVDGRLTVRLNRELLWQGQVEDSDGRIGLILESVDAAAVIEFQALQLFAAE